MAAAPRPASATGAQSISPPFRAAFLGPRFWPTWLALWLLWLLSWLPWPVRSALAAAFGPLARLSSRKRREIVRVNLRLCYPQLDEPARERLLRLHFRYRLRSVLDYGLLWWGSARRIGKLVRIRGEEHFRAPHDRGRTVILLTCHSLMLDFGAAALVSRYLAVGLIKPARNPLVDWVMQRRRQRFGGYLHSRTQGIRPIIAALRAGAFFYYLPDEDLGDRGSTFAPFFRTEAATLTALSRIAKITDAVVVPAFTRYLPGRGHYEQVLFPALENFPSGDLRADATRMNREIEKLIALAPEQYMWTMRRFRTRPDGGPNPYDRAGV